MLICSVCSGGEIFGTWLDVCFSAMRRSRVGRDVIQEGKNDVMAMTELPSTMRFIWTKARPRADASMCFCARAVP